MRKVTPAYRDFIAQYQSVLYVSYLGLRSVGILDPRGDGLLKLPQSTVVLPDGTMMHFRRLADYLQKMIFIYLVALLEDYLLRALETLYQRMPSKLPMDKDRVVRFRDILKAKSKDELIEMMIRQEVRGVHRSLPEMIDQFRKFSVDVGREGLELPHFVEMKATRNLLVHKGGRVDAQYLRDTIHYWRMLDDEPPGEDSTPKVNWQYVHHKGDLALGLVNTIEGHILDHFPRAGVVEQPRDWEGPGPGDMPYVWPSELKSLDWSSDVDYIDDWASDVDYVDYWSYSMDDVDDRTVDEEDDEIPF